jgi:hypothetical protein
MHDHQTLLLSDPTAPVLGRVRFFKDPVKADLPGLMQAVA